MRSSKRFEQNTLKLRVRLFRITQNRTGGMSRSEVSPNVVSAPVLKVGFLVHFTYLTDAGNTLPLFLKDLRSLTALWQCAKSRRGPGDLTQK